MAHTPQANNASDVQALFPWTGESMQFAEQAYRDWLRRAETVQTHALEFWNAELAKGIEAMNLMAQCTTAAEAFGVQTRYATEAMQDLIAEGQKVVEQMAAIAQTSFAAQAAVAEATEVVVAEEDATAKRSSRRRS
jgi:hypothetical protein